MGLIKSFLARRVSQTCVHNLSQEDCLFAESGSRRRERSSEAGCFSAELLQLAALPHTAPVTNLCLIRGNSQQNIVEPALGESKDPTTSLSLPSSLTYSFLHPFSDACSPPTSSNSKPTASPPPTAYYNLHGGALSRLASDNMCAGETERLAEHDGGSERAVQLLLVFI